VGPTASIRPRNDSAESDKLYQLIYDRYDLFKNDPESPVWESELLKRKLCKAMAKHLGKPSQAGTNVNSLANSTLISTYYIIQIDYWHYDLLLISKLVNNS